MSGNTKMREYVLSLLKNRLVGSEFEIVSGFMDEDRDRADRAERRLKSVVDHWAEFGPAEGFDELLDRVFPPLAPGGG